MTTRQPRTVRPSSAAICSMVALASAPRAGSVGQEGVADRVRARPGQLEAGLGAQEARPGPASGCPRRRRSWGPSRWRRGGRGCAAPRGPARRWRGWARRSAWRRRPRRRRRARTPGRTGPRPGPDARGARPACVRMGVMSNSSLASRGHGTGARRGHPGHRWPERCRDANARRRASRTEFRLDCVRTARGSPRRDRLPNSSPRHPGPTPRGGHLVGVPARSAGSSSRPAPPRRGSRRRSRPLGRAASTALDHRLAAGPVADQPDEARASAPRKTISEV